MRVPAFTSCVEEGYLFIFSFNPYYLNKGDSAVFWVEGGVPPYDWTVDNSSFSLETDQTSNQYNIITAAGNLTSLETCNITVIDSCGNTVSGLTCCCNINAVTCCNKADYSFEKDYDNPQIFVEGESYKLYVIGGCPPYKWETLPTNPGDYEFEHLYTQYPYNYLNTYTKDKSFSIRITDSCGGQIGPNGFDIEQAVTVLDRDTFDALGGFRYFGLYEGCSKPSYVYPNMSPDNADEVNVGEIAENLQLSNGLPPYIWDVGIFGEFWSMGSLGSVIVGNFTGVNIKASEDGYGPITYGFMDICGNTGVDYIDIVQCCDFDTYIAPTIDETLTPDTIVKDDSITVYITTGTGCPPFTWANPGSGYSWAESETSGRSNILTCVGGSCGVDFGAVVSVSVTDDCGNADSIDIRNTAGSLTQRCCSSAGGCSGVVQIWDSEGAFTYRVWVTSDGGCGAPPCKSCDWNGGTYEKCAAEYGHTKMTAMCLYTWGC